MDVNDAGHDMQMSIFGSMSKMERTVMQKRVRDSMASLASRGGRYMGGRPPYGYGLADAGPHPNPSKAADGKRLHRLEPDPVTGPVVVLIFDLFVAGESLGSIASILVERGHPSPSAHDPKRNQHRLGEGWAKSAVRAILLNQRYTGHEVFRKQPARYELIDPENPAYGDSKVQRWADPASWIVSEQPVHEALVTSETFEAVQGRFQKRSAQTKHKPRVSKYDYLFKSRITCGACARRMEGSRNNGFNHYRCRVRNDYALPDSTQHPRTLYLPERTLASGVDEWILRAFEPGNLDDTVRRLAAAADAPVDAGAKAALIDEVRNCDALLTRYKFALAASSESITTVVAWIKEAEARRTRAEQALARLRPARRLDPALIKAVLAGAPTVRDRLYEASSASKRTLYEALDVRLCYQPREREVHLAADLAGACGTRTCPRGDLNPHPHY